MLNERFRFQTETGSASDKLWKNKLYRSVIFGILASTAPFSALAVTIQNPISSNSLPEFINNISRAIIAVVLPIAVVFIIYAGFKLLLGSAQGNPGEMEKAKKMLGWVVVGTIIVVGASALAMAVVNFAGSL